MHVRVHHWNAFIDEMRTSDGLLPVYTAEIPLPVDVCSKKILRKTGKASRWGSKMFVLDLLVEDSKLPATTKLGFDTKNLMGLTHFSTCGERSSAKNLAVENYRKNLR